ncbi:ABC transporter ATP-binding protein [Rugosimonospora africana]|uniref:ABC transporter ATP-binding protein n=1 Tax=Rugosimonospora africana TaxID=556532 RepID=UPI001EF29EB8|nr:ABC transporter ATP-binding protein [Rugosimonospora africana]
MRESPALAAVRRTSSAGLLAVRAAPRPLVLYVILTLGVGVLPVVSAWLTRLLIDGLVTREALNVLLTLAAGLAAAGLVTAVTPQISQYLRAELDRRVGLLAADRLFSAVCGLIGLRRFEDPHFLDRLRLAQQSGETAPSQTVDGVLGVARASVTISGFMGSMFLLNPAMTILVLVSGLPTLIAQIALSRRRARMLWDIGPAQRREFFYSHLLSTVEAAKEVRLFSLGGFLRARMLTERRTANAATRATDRRQMAVQAGLGLLAALMSGAGLIWAVDSARQGQLSIGDVTIFVSAVAGTQAGLSTIAIEFARAHQALLMFDHYLAVTTVGQDLPVAARPHRAPPLRHGIELRDVWFRYSDEHPWVLRGVNLHIPHGTTLAVVGLNGAGKSTLVKLLCRFYDPTRGAILWDGTDIRDVNAADLRRRIGAVFQDYMHYEMTAAENIALGDLDAWDDRGRIRAAATRAGIDAKLAALPGGYDTLLSRMFFMESDKEDPATGVSLSGGQWQRLALARAFIRDDCDLMILDEPSAGLDAESEHDIHVSLREHRRERTSVLISHRLSSVRDADRIVVLGDGVIVEQGDHDTLTTAGGEYSRLFALQASGYQDSVVDRPAS